MSSTILLASGNGIVTHVGGPKPRVRPPASAAARKKDAAAEAKRTWGLTAAAEGLALVKRYVNQRE